MNKYNYQSPISVTISELTNEITEKRENFLFNTIKEQLSIDIDREELMKALKYDRDQYNIGYVHGYKKGLEEGKNDAMRTLAKTILSTYGTGEELDDKEDSDHD